jgi:hypothetical protein
MEPRGPSTPHAIAPWHCSEKLPINDPASERDAEKAAGNFQQLADRYLSEYAETKKKPRSVASDRTNLTLNILPLLGQRRVTDITRADIAKLHHDLRHKPGAANRCLALPPSAQIKKITPSA